MNAPSPFLLLAHGLLALFVCWGWSYAWRRANGGARQQPDVVQLVLLGWLVATYLLARSGALVAPAGSPPRMIFLLGPAALALIALALSPFGARLIAGLPLGWIVLTQVFRLPVELILFELHREGVIPVQMTFEGQNFDVLTALSAVVVWLVCRKREVKGLVLAWNLLGLALLARIVFIAVRAMPGPWPADPVEPQNTIVLTSAFVWIPGLYVLTALFVHVLVFRALFAQRASTAVT